MKFQVNDIVYTGGQYCLALEVNLKSCGNDDNGYYDRCIDFETNDCGCCKDEHPYEYELYLQPLEGEWPHIRYRIHGTEGDKGTILISRGSK